MGGRRASRDTFIEATPQECFDALVDFDSYPEWQEAVKEVEVHTRERGSGRGKRVEFEIDAKVRRVRYVLDYRWEEPGLLTWDFVEGDVKDVDGEFTLEQEGDGTRATYSLHIDPGFWVPGKVVSTLSDQVMQRSVDDLKARVEGA